MNPQALVDAIFDENRKLLATVSQEGVDHFIKGLEKAENIFCAAHGRSGYILRCFCMRLMQSGYSAFFVGETITPRIGKGDLLIVLSGSGQTALTQEWIRISQEQGAATLGIVGNEDSPIARALDKSLSLKTRNRQDSSIGSGSIQPPGSLFEQAAFALLETIILALYQRQGSNPRIVLDRHANLE